MTSIPSRSYTALQGFAVIIGIAGASFYPIQAQNQNSPAAQGLMPPPPMEVKKPQASKGSEEVKKPTPFTDQEMRVVQNAASMPLGRLVELMQVYEKLENEPMLQILARQVLKRDPKNADALRIQSTLSPDEEVRPADYLARLSQELQTAKRVEDPEGIATLARSLLEEQQPAFAVLLLETLQRGNYPKETFPFRTDLASAYQDNGEFDKAEAAWSAILADKTASREEREEAERAKQTLALLRRIDKLRTQAKINPAEGVISSAQLFQELPNDPAVIAFRIEALMQAKQGKEALQFISGLKQKAAPKKPFEYQEEFADALLLIGAYDRAAEAYRTVANDEASSPADRANAVKMMRQALMQKDINRGNAALDGGNIKAANTILERLEKQYPNDPEVLSYRAWVLAKSGHQNDALALLLTERVKAAQARQLFLQMDTLADVYLERGEYNLARSAYEDILHTPGYDNDTRAQAVKGLELVKKSRLLDEGSRAISSGDLPSARRCLEELKNLAPGDRDVILLEADLYLTTGETQKALVIYETMKLETPGGVPFGSQTSLAEAYKKLGQWEKSLEALDVVLSTPGYDANTQRDAQWSRRELLPWVRPHATLEMQYYKEGQGTALRELATFSSTWWNDWRLIARQRVDHISLDTSGNYFTDDESTRLEAEVLLQRRFEGGWFAEIGLGGAQDHLLYSARVGRFETADHSWSLGYVGNSRATYSLPLEILNGREDRIELQAAGTLHPRVRYGVDAYASWVRVDDDSLGHGYGVTGNLEYIITQETRTSPEVTLGYFGEYSKFKAKGELPDSVASKINYQALEVQRALAATDEVRKPLPATADLKKALPANFGREIFETLVDDETNRHGIQLGLSKKINDSFTFYIQGGPYYDVDGGHIEVTAALGFQYWVRENTMLYAEVRYNSEGRGSSAGSDVIEGLLGAEVSF